MKIVTAEQMRRIEDRSELRGVSKDALMENAGVAAARHIRRRCAPLTGVPVLVLVGPGNNGGDGLVVARHLKRWGASVTAYICVDRRTPDPKLSAAEDAGVAVILASADDGLAQLRAKLNAAHIVVDAVFGIGQLRPIEGTVAGVLAMLSDARMADPHTLVVALDVPSGMDADSGASLPECPAADLTLAMGYPKPCHFAYAEDGAVQTKCGALEVLDIGLPPGVDDDVRLSLMTADYARERLPQRPKAAHKGSFGKTLVVAGSQNYIGAAYLAATAATRSGSGLVTLALPAAIQMAVAAKAVEPTYLPLPDDDADTTAAIALDAMPNYNSLLVGCGMGQAANTQRFIDAVLCSDTVSQNMQQQNGQDTSAVQAKRLPPCVIDADGLNALANTQRWWERLPDEAILTPHAGEMARLCGASITEVQADRIGIAVQSAVQWNKTVVLKGAYTVVAYPDGAALVSPFANAGLATAGTGDVLAGCIAGLLSQSVSPQDAAALGVYLHASAGERVSERLGDMGMVASDLLPQLPLAIKALRQGAAG